MNPTYKSINQFFLILLGVILAIILSTTGYRLLTKDSSPNNKQNQEASQAVPSKTTNGTDKWDTYTNEAKTLTFKYPPGWNVDDKKSVQIIVANFDFNNQSENTVADKGYIIVRLIYDYYHFQSLEEWLEDWKESCKEGLCQFLYPESVEWTNIGSSKSVKINYSFFRNVLDGKSYSYYILEDRNLHEIGVYLNKDQEENKTINQILSTFQFIE
jgi:hypothetical protein